MTLEVRDNRGLRQGTRDRVCFWSMWTMFVAMAFGWQAIVLLVGVATFALISLLPIFGRSLAKLLATVGVPRDPLSSESAGRSRSRLSSSIMIGLSLLYWLFVVIVGYTLIIFL